MGYPETSSTYPPGPATGTAPHMGSIHCPGHSPPLREHARTVSGCHPCQRWSYTVLRETQHAPSSVAVRTNIVRLHRRTLEPYCETLCLHLGLPLCQPTILGKNLPCYFQCPIKFHHVLQLFLPFFRHLSLWCVKFDEYVYIPPVGCGCYKNRFTV